MNTAKAFAAARFFLAAVFSVIRNMALACGAHSILDIGIHDVRHVWNRAPAGFGTKGNDAALLAHDRLEAEQVSPSCIFETIGKFPGECDGRILAANRLLLTMCALELHFNSSVSTQFNVYRIVHSARKDTANDKLPTNGKHIRVYRVRKVERFAARCVLLFLVICS